MKEKDISLNNKIQEINKNKQQLDILDSFGEEE